MDAALQNAKYVSLVTFRKDGREVATPVWVVPMNGKLCFYTDGNSGKAKRIRGTGRVKVAPSDVRGRPFGAYTEGSGRILTSPAEQKPVHDAIRAKYGWQHYLVNLLSTLSGRKKTRVGVELSI